MRNTNIFKIIFLFFITLLSEGISQDFTAGNPKRSYHQNTFTKEESMFRSINPNSKILVVAFGGIWGGFGMPRYEFMNILSNFSVSTLFVRDMQRAYYQYGIEPLGNITDTLAILKDEIRKIGAKKILIFGNSAGGYAALLFGYCLARDQFPVSEVHAFAPIFASKKIIESRFNKYPNIEKEFFDLKSYFSQKNAPSARFHIYYALDHPPDVSFSSQFREFQWVQLHPYPKGGHTIVKDLRDCGILFDIIEKAVARTSSLD